VILYFTIFEYLQLIDSFKKKKIFFYITSFKNLFELIGFPLFIATLLIPNSELKSSFYSITILLAYWILLMKLDKFFYLGKFVDVFGSIIKKSIPIFIIVLINLISFVLSFRNRTNQNFITNYNQSEEISNQLMTHFNGTFSNSIFKTFEFLVGNIITENMGVEVFNLHSFVNFLIYGLFIFIMTILFINIFTGISIDEIQKLIKHSEAQITSRKIEYVFKLEGLNKIYLQELIYKKLHIFQKKIGEHKCFQCFAKQLTNIKNMLINIKNYEKMMIIIEFIKKILKFLRISYSYLSKYFNDCCLKHKTDQKKNIDLKNNSNEEFDRMKNQINELKLIIQTKFESIDRNMKKGNSNLEERLEKRFEKQNQMLSSRISNIN